jgi:hypothetical protein
MIVPQAGWAQIEKGAILSMVESAMPLRLSVR